jgi:DNA-binding HxlR family transcriptional regulator
MLCAVMVRSVAATEDPQDAFGAACQTRDLFAAISNKWIGLILVALADGPKRYSELQKVIEGISQKMLTQSLRLLERDGLVTRTVIPSSPVRVDYEITPLGRSLMTVMAAMKQWAEAHVDEVLEARAAFARAQAGSPR